MSEAVSFDLAAAESDAIEVKRKWAKVSFPANLFMNFELKFAASADEKCSRTNPKEKEISIKASLPVNN